MKRILLLSLAALAFTFTTTLPVVEKSDDRIGYENVIKYFDKNRGLFAQLLPGNKYTAKKGATFSQGHITGDELNKEEAKELFKRLKADRKAQEAAANNAVIEKGLSFIEKIEADDHTQYFDRNRRLFAAYRLPNEFTAKKNAHFGMGYIFGDKLNEEEAKALFQQLKADHKAIEAVKDEARKAFKFETSQE